MKAINIEWDKDDANIELPTEMEIPDGMTDEEEISDFLSDETGFCHCGFDLVEDEPTKEEKPKKKNEVER